jgi:predicted dehydrogenase
VKKKGLVVGSGPWATKVGQILSDRKQFNIKQVSARDFISDFSAIDQIEIFDIGVSATSPSLQEIVAPRLAQISKHLWLEKPISQSLHSGRKFLMEMAAEKNSFALVNFSWLFSSVWKEFESLNQRIGDVATIQIFQKAREQTHAYISPIEDYGSHDIALINKWIISSGISERQLALEQRNEFQFNSNYEDLEIAWRVDFGSRKREMIWTITWKDDSESYIDFYGGNLVHNHEKKIVPEQDNIDSFLSTLFTRDQYIGGTNHQIAIKTKEFFSTI